MHNHKGHIIGLVLVLFGIGLIVMAILLERKNVFNKIKSSKDCVLQPPECGKDASCCAVWDGSQCRKGKIKGNSCVSKGKVLPAILLILGVISIISGIIVFFVYKN